MSKTLACSLNKSEALLIEGDKYYRVNTEGKKILLMEVISKKN